LIGVVSSNCCPNRSAALVFTAWAALAFASCRSDSAAAFRSSATWAGWGWTLLDAAHPIVSQMQIQALGANTAPAVVHTQRTKLAPSFVILFASCF